MDIFESLEQLNVSEECFDDIVSMVEAMLSENIFDQIEKVHGKVETRLPDEPFSETNKAGRLFNKAVHARHKELMDAARRDAGVSKREDPRYSRKELDDINKARKRILKKRRGTKNGYQFG